LCLDTVPSKASIKFGYLGLRGFNAICPRTRLVNKTRSEHSRSQWFYEGSVLVSVGVVRKWRILIICEPTRLVLLSPSVRIEHERVRREWNLISEYPG
jgi:hypothetical protein